MTPMEPATRQGGARTWVVSEFGAIGDGVTNDTGAIQRAIDDAARSGGGRVVVPAGCYLIGTIRLRDDIDLHLSAGAVLVVSDSRDDYRFVAFHPERVPDRTWPILLLGEDVARVRISGTGQIEGGGARFWGAPPVPGEDYRWHRKLDTWRPHMIGLLGCHDVTITGITISDPPVYGANIVNCTDVRLDDVHFEHDPTGPNTDGVHFSSCHRVVVSNCTFVTGDDGVAFDGNGQGDGADLLISECRFRCSTKMLRVFTGLAPWLDNGTEPIGAVRGVRVHDCVVEEAPSVIGVVAHRGDIEDVSVRNVYATLTMPGVAVFIMADHGSIRGVHVDGLVTKCTGILTASARRGDLIDGIRVERSRFEVSPGPRPYGLGYPDPIPAYYDYHRGAYNIYLRNLRHVTLDDVTVRWTRGVEGQSWPTITALDVARLDMSRIRVGHSDAADAGASPPPLITATGGELHRIESCQTGVTDLAPITAQPG